jgi:predicted enzyme related to lactoylglutathione lyase
VTEPLSLEFGGIHHLALVSSDMQRTVDFYSGVLGMPRRIRIREASG